MLPRRVSEPDLEELLGTVETESSLAKELSDP